MTNTIEIVQKNIYNLFGDTYMIIDLSSLKNNIDSKIDIDINYSFTKEQLRNTDIRKLDDVKIKGTITKDVMNNYYLNLNIIGNMILPCSVTLKDVVYPFECQIDGEIDEIMNEIDEFYKKSENSLDIFPIIWENILMEIPMKVVSGDATDYRIEGNGWKLITEDDVHEEINPELAKLKDLL